MYDTHSHLNFKAFAKDYHQVIENSLKAGVKLNLVGSDFNTSRRAVEIAEEYPAQPVYAAVGLHPIHLEKSKVKSQKSKIQIKNQKKNIDLKTLASIHYWDYKKYKELAGRSKVAAIGETGLDYYRLADDAAGEMKQLQKQIFLEHLKLAIEVKKPLIIHCRPSKNSFDAYFDLIEILKSAPQKISQYPNIPISQLSGVVHCFLANWPITKQLLDLNLYISLTGIITYKNIDNYIIEAVKKIPLDRLMIETDCPYLSPEPKRGQRNLPLNVKYIVQKIAEIKNADYDEVIKATDENAGKLFDV